MAAVLRRAKRCARGELALSGVSWLRALRGTGATCQSSEGKRPLWAMSGCEEREAVDSPTRWQPEGPVSRAGTRRLLTAMDALPPLELWHHAFPVGAWFPHSTGVAESRQDP